MKAGFISIVLVLALLPLLINGLEIHQDTYIGMEQMKSILILQQQVHETVYEIENGFRMAVQDGLNAVNEFYRIDPTGITGKAARGIVCAAVDAWQQKNPDFYFDFNCLLSLQINFYEKSARLYSDFIAEKIIHKAKVTAKIPAGTVIK